MLVVLQWAQSIRRATSTSSSPLNQQMLTWDTFTDEVSGKPLKTSLVEAARAEELDFAKKAPWFLGLGANSGVLGSNRSSSNRFKMD